MKRDGSGASLYCQRAVSKKPNPEKPINPNPTEKPNPKKPIHEILKPTENPESLP
jgi:hypothetical protein